MRYMKLYKMFEWQEQFLYYYYACSQLQAKVCIEPHVILEGRIGVFVHEVHEILLSVEVLKHCL